MKIKKDENSTGVLRITVIDSFKNPLAERIVFKNPKSRIIFRVKNDKKFNYSPGI
jgi:hypothetical protein